MNLNYNNIDKGVKFILDNFNKTLELIDSHPEYKHLKGRVISEYSRIKYIKHTGNMYEHFLKFKDGNHKYAGDFAFLEDYGILSNENISDYLLENYQEEINNYSGIEDLVIGNIYSNSEIANTFKCSNMGGMRRSLDTNSLVLIAKHNNPLYDDQWTDDGILNYTGMGTVGDQNIQFAQNKTLAIAKNEGIKVYLFESYKDNEYYYAGEVELCGSIYQADEIDAEGNIRKVVKFPLRRIDITKPIIVKKEDIELSETLKLKEVKKLSQEEIKEKAKMVNPEVSTKEVVTVYRERSQVIAEDTKNRANGICDLCGEEAPFKDKNGKPYLESHHVITLAEDGLDAIYNTVAICPNCHRRIHVLKSKEDTEKLEKVILKYLLSDNDKENIIKFEELFK